MAESNRDLLIESIFLNIAGRNIKNNKCENDTLELVINL